MGCLSILSSTEPRHVILRPYLVYGSSIFLLLSVFVFFALFGWPGGPIGCIYEEPHDGCYCEAFNLEDVEEGKPGIRQPVNTWSSLFSIVTSAIIAWRMSEDRKQLYDLQQQQAQEQTREDSRHSATTSGGHGPHITPTNLGHGCLTTPQEGEFQNHAAAKQNVMKSDNLIADWYVLTAVWSGLGKMYFHGSLLRWATYVDGVSSNFFYSYLPWYTFRRIHRSQNADFLFWIGYFVTVIAISSLQIIFGSLLAAHIFLIFYFFMELYIFASTGMFLGASIRSAFTWLLAFGLFLVAAGFWWASQTGRVMCDPESPWQIHGLVWHPAVCVVMVLLYLYWRDAKDVPCIGEAEEAPHRNDGQEERKRRTRRMIEFYDLSDDRI